MSSEIVNRLHTIGSYINAIIKALPAVAVKTATVKLTAANIRSLDTGEGVLLVRGVHGKSLTVHSLEFYVPAAASAYTTNGAKLYVDWQGNYVNASDAWSWTIPTDVGAITLLTTNTQDVRVLSENRASYQAFPLSAGVVLNTSSPITGGLASVTIRVTYSELSNLSTFVPPVI